MQFILVVLIWCLLAAIAWPVALLVRIGGALALIKSLLFLPARLLGYRG
jgi:hypothetical protein